MNLRWINCGQYCSRLDGLPAGYQVEICVIGHPTRFPSHNRQTYGVRLCHGWEAPQSLPVQYTPDTERLRQSMVRYRTTGWDSAQAIGMKLLAEHIEKECQDLQKDMLQNQMSECDKTLRQEKIDTKYAIAACLRAHLLTM